MRLARVKLSQTIMTSRNKLSYSIFYKSVNFLLKTPKNYKLFLMTMYVKNLFFVILNKKISHYCAFSRLIKL